MAWYYGTYFCGHEGRVNITGPTKDRKWKADKKFNGLCPECYQKQLEEEREKANKEAAEKSDEMELPELLGSEKQVAWANTLRLKIIEKYEKQILEFDERIEKAKEYLRKQEENGTPSSKRLEDVKLFILNDKYEKVYTSREELSDALDHVIQNHTDAKFWIDNRFDAWILVDFILEYREFQKTNDIPDEVKTELNEEKEQLTVVPESDTLKNGVVEIRYNNNILSVQYIKDEDFIKIVKGLNYKWNGTFWEKEITEYTGTADDRSAEIGNKLLANGFTVRFPSEKSKEKAISSDFEWENDRWVKYNIKTGELSIFWEKRSSVLYEAAKKLPSAKWKNGSMKIKIEFYKEVEDFAETMGFSISSTAKKKIEEYKAKERGFEKASVSVKEKNCLSDKEKIEKALKSDGTIIKDLLEE